MPAVYHFGRVQQGRIVWANAEQFFGFLRQFEGKEIRAAVEAKPARKRTRNQAQNGYYFGVVVPIIAECIGVEVEEAHEMLKRKFLMETKAIEYKGRKLNVEIPRSTASLGVGEFGEYVDKIVAWAAQFFGAYIPPPDLFREGE